ncbi:hypothetical protein A5784_12115 [Mycobacterium sp. 852013-50091_SCH5140682]|uniref:DUF1772 domain-containing protein n=1 Tax=Mycobacterium sp. 852013-50091_SCH5140682 TaxID=1834109 RepID=UPI0007EC2AE1|nr:DUF1772 domain-containing protein [Mycobacterium sp. 852013-50091_SCH5140682]OBC04864.1 hypothetical protein A5784_12115 [Mycobacterium sp. 852013-50091_SCH5140682]
MEQIVQIVAVLVMGTLVGVEFGVAAFTNPIVERLPDDAYRQARATGGRILGTVMPFWYFTAAALLVGVWWLGRSPLAIAAAAVMGVIIVLTLTTLVPINNRVAASGGAGAEEVPVRELSHRWDRLHWLRVALLAVAFVLLVVAGAH